MLVATVPFLLVVNPTVPASSVAEVRERFAAQGAEVVGAGPEALGAALREDVVKWGRVVKTAGIKID